MRGRSRNGAGAEALGWLIALALSTASVAHLSVVRAEMMFLDGDSLVTVLIATSVRLGHAQDWAMSPVMFVPETSIHLLLSLLGLGVRGTLMLDAVVNMLLLYGAIRVVAGSRARHPAAMPAALCSFAAFCALAALEAEGERFFLFAGLMALTTYYSATVIASVLTIGIVRRIVDERRAGGGTLVLLGGVALVSMLTNPLYAPWAAAPAGLVLLIVALRRRADRRTAFTTLAALAAGSGAGLVVHELVFARWIMAERGDYLRPGLLPHAIGYYGDFLAGVFANPGGPVWAVVLVCLWALMVCIGVRAMRRGETGTAFVSATAIVAAAATIAVTLLTGSEALRYLQPLVFLPVLGIALLPLRRPASRPRRGEDGGEETASPGEASVAAPGRPPRPARRAAAVIAASASVVVVAASVPVLATQAGRTDADVACVTTWIEETGATGVGDFWTIRAPKAYLDDPSPLIQITDDFIIWPWLTNRTDYAGAEATFVLIDHDSPELIYPQGFSAEQARTVSCGRYTILDFGERVLPLGP